ncbi:single-stranded DNA-binding protein [Kitasatospora purpeofusca]|uniref:single-stranded DNA-binding protein n=1 Tax=Kitasatospora purpeofusca TaxID=67352 RepID=UPI0035DFB052
MFTTENEEPTDTGVVLDVRIESHAPTLLVLQAKVVLPWGREEFALAMPTAPQGSAAWQCAHIALYLDAVRKGDVQPGAAALSDFLRARPGAATLLWDYRFEAQNDQRVECLLSLVLKPGAPGQWPGVSLSVVEREPGRSGFHRPRFWGSAREIAEESLAEIAGERDNLAARARSLGSSALAGLAKEAAALADRVEPVWRALRGEGQREGAEQARAALRGTAVEPSKRTTALLPREAPLILNGTVLRVSKPVEDDGEVATRLLLEPDRAHREHLSPVTAQLLCRLAGPLADRVSRFGLEPGDRVAVSGRLEVRHYRAADGVPRSAVVFMTEGLGLGEFAARS